MMFTETVELTDSTNNARFITPCHCSNIEPTPTLTLSNDPMNPAIESVVCTLPTSPIYTPRSSASSEKSLPSIEETLLTSQKPIYTHKPQDNFFSSSSPLVPITLSVVNTPISSPHIHPTVAKSCRVVPIRLNMEKLSNPFNLSQSFVKNTHQLCLEDFDIKQTVGTGSFARVHLAKSKVNGKYYAIKAINKKEMISRRQVEHVNNERTVLASTSHPFLVKLWGTFQSESHVFLVMDYVPGGELFRVIRKNKKLTEDAAKFYAAQVTLAIEYLHEQQVVYRDLKPENILIDHRGHIKFTDFGFAKKIPDDMTWTVCGTPDYLAPEIIRSQGYTKAVDWWSLGVLIYEMLVGKPPFCAKNPIDQYQKILLGEIIWPDDMSAEARDLIQNLLMAKPAERFGNLKNGAEDIKCHAWFKSIDFADMFACQITPPYVPDVKFAGDTHCFDYYEELNVPYHLLQTDKPYRDHFPNF